MDVPTTAAAELWNSLYQYAGIDRLSPWMIWSRFQMGGGGYLAALLLALGVIVLADWLTTGRPRWVAVSSAEFRRFMETHSGPISVMPAWDQPASRRIIWAAAPGQRGEALARCQHGRLVTKYYLRADPS